MNIKTTLLAAACALALSACGDKPAPAATPTTTTPAEAAPATPSETPPAANDTSTAPAGDTAAPAASTAPAAGSKTAVVTDCATEIDSNDAMQYNVNAIVVPASCTEFKITLRHVGKMPVAAMGHNVVITSSDDMQEVLADGMAAGLAQDYVKPDDDDVIAHTKMIGGGETTSVTFPVSKIKDGGPYKFFCSFPGHAALMNGSIEVK